MLCACARASAISANNTEARKSFYTANLNMPPISAHSRGKWFIGPRPAQNNWRSSRAVREREGANALCSGWPIYVIPRVDRCAFDREYIWGVARLMADDLRTLCVWNMGSNKLYNLIGLPVDRFKCVMMHVDWNQICLNNCFLELEG